MSEKQLITGIVSEDDDRVVVDAEPIEAAGNLVTARDVALKRADELPVAARQEDLVAMAISRDLDIDKLQALIEMRNKEEDRQARKMFAQKFSEMQAEFTAAVRSKEGYGYKYAPLDVLQKAYGPTIAKWEFSYHWQEAMLENGSKRVTMTVSGWGWQQDTVFDVPPVEGTERMNAVQVAGAMSTYGRRYTFIAGFGVIIADEDSDAADLTFEAGVKYSEYINAMEAEPTIEDLRATTKVMHDELKAQGDEKGAKILRKKFEELKEKLS